MEERKLLLLLLVVGLSPYCVYEQQQNISRRRTSEYLSPSKRQKIKAVVVSVLVRGSTAAPRYTVHWFIRMSRRSEF